MTMSISSAPASAAARVSAILMSRNVWPDGKPVATEATLTVEPLRASFGLLDERRIDAQRGDDWGCVGSPGWGCIAFAASARILPGVSFPSSVVRSIIRIARSRAQSFEAFLIERFFRLSTRSSTPTWSTRADAAEQRARARQAGRPTSGRARGRARGRGCRGGGWSPWDGEDTPVDSTIQRENRSWRGRRTKSNRGSREGLPWSSLVFALASSPASPSG